MREEAERASVSVQISSVDLVSNRDRRGQRRGAAGREAPNDLTRIAVQRNVTARVAAGGDDRVPDDDRRRLIAEPDVGEPAPADLATFVDLERRDAVSLLRLAADFCMRIEEHPEPRRIGRLPD